MSTITPMNQNNELRWERLSGSSSAEWLLLLLLFMTFCNPLPQFHSWARWPKETSGSDSLWLLILDNKRHLIFCFALLDTHAGESQQPCHDNAEEALWRSLYGLELRPLANSQHQLASCMNEPSWKQIFQFPVKPLATAALANILAITSGETSSHNSPAKPLCLRVQSQTQNQ